MATSPGLAVPDQFAVSDQFEVAEHVTLWQDAWRRVRRNRLALVGAGIILVLVAVALLSVVWTPYPIYKQAIGPTYQPPSLRHLFGLDQAGRDILSRIMVGAFISIQVGVGTMVIVSVIGIALGLLSGYYRGRVDAAVSLLINIWYGIPDLLVVILLVLLFGRSLSNIIIAIAVTRWMDMARLVRGQTLSLREREFVEAAQAVGTRNAQILLRHILPNALGTIIVQATFAVPQAILFEAFLSFLGLGVPPPTPSWGSMASDGFHALELAPHIVLVPAIALSLTLMAFNFVGDGLRDALDPRMRR
jgi:oligopeptide transport system permease protein